MKINKKPKGYGFYTPEKVRQSLSLGGLSEGKNGIWYPVRPESYHSFTERIRYAWDVLTYKAEPLYWYFDEGYVRTKNGIMNESTFNNLTKEEK